MKELTDLEICIRIAEIENLDDMKISSSGAVSVPSGEFWQIEYNPLTDDALCFQLMVKHEVEAIPLVSGVSGRHSAIARVFNGQDDFIEFKAQSGTLNRAICLAIIQSHG